MKIFVTGFERSGTTLMNTLIGAHPEVKRMWHEKAWLLGLTKDQLKDIIEFPERISFNDDQKKREIVKVDYDWYKDTWGDKVPYCNTYLNNQTRKTIFDLCNIWLDAWEEEARIVHMIRHPWDAIFSTYTQNSPNPAMKLRKYKDMVPKFMKLFGDNPRVLTVKYEYLLTYPKIVLYDLFDWLSLGISWIGVKMIVQGCNLNFGKIEKGRAFNYRYREFSKEEFPVSSLLSTLNKYHVQGPIYDEK